MSESITVGIDLAKTIFLVHRATPMSNHLLRADAPNSKAKSLSGLTANVWVEAEVSFVGLVLILKIRSRIAQTLTEN